MTYSSGGEHIVERSSDLDHDDYSTNIVEPTQFSQSPGNLFPVKATSTPEMCRTNLESSFKSEGNIKKAIPPNDDIICLSKATCTQTDILDVTSKETQTDERNIPLDMNNELDSLCLDNNDDLPVSPIFESKVNLRRKKQGSKCTCLPIKNILSEETCENVLIGNPSNITVDHIAIFFEDMARDLREINNPLTQVKLRQKISKMIYEARISELCESMPGQSNKSNNVGKAFKISDISFNVSDVSLEFSDIEVISNQSKSILKTSPKMAGCKRLSVEKPSTPPSSRSKLSLPKKKKNENGNSSQKFTNPFDN